MSNRVLFINKSATSKTLTRSEGVERSKIFSHVQQLPGHAFEQFRVTGWDVSTAINYAPKKSPDVPSGDEVDKSGSRHRRKGGPAQASFDYEQRCAAIIRLIGIGSPFMDLEISKLDPFDCAAVPLDAYMTSLLKAYCNSFLGQVFKVKSWAIVNLQYQLKYASESAELLYAILCTSAGVIFAQSKDTKHAYYAMQFKGQALHHLYRSIDLIKGGEAPSIAVVFAIGFQVYLECVQGEMDAARSHYTALLQCIATIGPVKSIPLPIRVGMMVPSFAVSSMLSERPIMFPIFEQGNEDFTSLFVDELVANEGMTSTIEELSVSGFSNHATHDLLGPKLCKVISNISEIQQTRGSHAEKTRSPSRSEVKKLFTSRKDIEYNILSIPFESPELTPEQDAVRLALYLVCKPTLFDTPMTPAFNRTMAVQIRSALERTSLSTKWSPCSALLMWVFVVAASVSQDGEQRAWVVGQAASLRDKLHLQSPEEMEGVLSEFFFPRIHFADILRSLWADMGALP